MVKLEAVSLLNRQICLHPQQDTSTSTKLSFASCGNMRDENLEENGDNSMCFTRQKICIPSKWDAQHTSSSSQILWERCKIDRLAPEDFYLNSSFSDCQHLGLQTKYPNIVQLCTLRFSFKEFYSSSRVRTSDVVSLLPLHFL